jgi:hypothetical protein
MVQELSFFPETLSTSRDFEVYNNCQYKWYKLRCAAWSRSTYNNDLSAGGEFAKSMELTRNAYYKEGKNESDSIKVGVDNLQKDFTNNYYFANSEDSVKTPAKMVEVFKKYFDEYPLDSRSITPLELGDGSIAVEQDFSIELPFTNPDTGKPIILKCKLDMLGQRDNVVYVVDEKTCKSVLTSHEMQLDLLRTQNQFVQYVTIGNMQKDILGNDLNITHVCIRKCKIKKSYAKNENIVESYEFQVDTWFQKTWYDNLLNIVENMLLTYNTLKTTGNNKFIRNYSHGCTAFFRPCILTKHCTSAFYQDITEEGFVQQVHTSTMSEPMKLSDFIALKKGDNL